MFPTSYARRLLVFCFLSCVCVAAIPTSAISLNPRLHVYVESAPGPEPHQATFSVYLDNPLDSVAGFEVWFMFERTGIMHFSVDPGPVVDTVGTLISGWDLVEEVSYSAEHIDLQVVALADDDPFDDTVKTGIPEGQSAGLLFRITADINETPDTLLGRCLELAILTSPVDNFAFSRPDGQLIGLAYTIVTDTSFYRCDVWDPVNEDSCLAWTQVTAPPYDSVEVATYSAPFVDTIRVEPGGDTVGTVLVESGEFCLPPPPCCGIHTGGTVGNCNCSIDGKVTLSDIARLIDRVYISHDSLCCENNGNTNGDLENKITLSDISAAIDHVFISKKDLPACADL